MSVNKLSSGQHRSKSSCRQIESQTYVGLRLLAFLLLASEGAKTVPEVLHCCHGHYFLCSFLSKCEITRKSREVQVSFCCSASLGILFIWKYFFLVGIRNKIIKMEK